MTERIYQTEEIKELSAALVKVQAGLKHAKKKKIILLQKKVRRIN